MKLIREWFASWQGLFVGLAVAGLALVALGGALEIPLMLAVGGALFGNSLGSFIGRVSNQAHEERLQAHEERLSNLVREGVKDSFVSDEEKIADARLKWHIYHVTQMSDKWVWRHSTLDFTKSQTPGRLTSKTYLLDKRKRRHPYSVEAGRRDERFIIFLKSEASEEPVITYVFPYMGLSFLSPRHHGVVFIQTWDGTHAISPAILSPEVLYDHAKEGTLPDEIARSLDREWRREIHRLNYFFPETTKMASLG
jgi:hypothetical protein